MAKKRASSEGGPTKSAAIEAYLSEHSGATGREVVEALAADGVSVSNSAVSQIRKKLSGGDASGEGNGSPSKSDAIRNYMKEHPEAANKDIAEALQAEGISVGVSLISNIRHTLKKKQGVPGKRGRKPKSAVLAAAPAGAKVAAAASNKGVTIEQVLAAKNLVDALGGIHSAKRAIEMLERLAT